MPFTPSEGAPSAQLAERLASRFGPASSFVPLAPDATTRFFFRLEREDGQRRVVMSDPGGGTAALDRMSAAQKTLAEIGVRTPAIEDRDDELSGLVLEDLGDVLLAGALPRNIMSVKDESSLMGRKHQVETCGRCHGDKKIIEKYKLEEYVMESFKESFHGSKLFLGHTKAPTCSSCHSSHDIRSKSDPASPIFGKNKLVTCGKCHKGANEKFVSAITHKRPAPIPHYGEKLLISLTIGVFAFIVLHVLLEAFADIRDAIFRKKEEEE